MDYRNKLRISRHLLPVMALSLMALASCSTVKRVTGIGRENPVTATDQASQLPGQDGAEIPSSKLTPLQTATLIDKIVYGKWAISEAGGQPVVSGDSDDAPERPYIVFDTMAVNPYLLKFYANTGCNILNGKMALTQDGHLTKAGEYAATMRFCPDAVHEQAIIDALNTAATYKVDRVGNNYVFYILNPMGNTTMVLRKNDMGFLDGAWEVTAIPPIKVSSDDMPEPMRLVFDMTEGRLHGNTGCNVLNATVTTDINRPNTLTIVDPATTRMACPNAGLEQQLIVALGKVASAQPGKDGTVNLLDSAGNTVLTLKHTDPTLD